MTRTTTVRRLVGATACAGAAVLLTAGTATAAPAAVPGAPTTVAATAGNASARVTWKAPTSNGGSPVTGYRATCASSSGGATGTATVGAVLAATVPALTNGRTYTCTVRAVNASGTGAASAASAAFVPVGPPTAPRGVGARTVSGTLTATWSAPSSTGGKPVSSYAVSCTSTDGGAALSGTTTGTTTSKAFSGLASNRTYRCAVKATGPGGTGPAGTSPYAAHLVVTAGGTASAHLPVVAGQAVSARVVSTSLPNDCLTTLETHDTDGTGLGQVCAAAAAFADGKQVRGAGTATARLVSSSGGPAGSADVVAWVFTEAKGTITAGGAAVPTGASVPGQNALLTFSGSAGQQVVVDVSANTINGTYVEVDRPDESSLGYVYITEPTAFVDTVTLPAAGTYTVKVDPSDVATGTLSLKLGKVPSNTGTIAVGTTQKISVTAPGQNPSRTFSGTAGQQLSATITGNTIPGTYVQVTRPDHSVLAYVYVSGGVSFLDTVTLPVNGTYTLEVDPSDRNTGSLSVKLGNVPPNTGTISIGTPQKITVGAPGQNPTRTFHGTAGQQLTATVTSNTVPGTYVQLDRPDGTTLSYVYVSDVSNGSVSFLDTVTLPVTGTYTLAIDPTDQNTGSLTVQLGLVPANKGTIAVGTATTVTITTAGQNATRTFSGSAGQVRSIDITANTIPGTYVEILRPDGSMLTYTYVSGATGSVDPVTLPSSGTYTVLVDPSDRNTGKITLRLHP